MKKLCVYDIEVLRNCFICCCKIIGGKVVKFEISTRKNDLLEMIEFFTSEEYVFVGYNCSHYDTPIMNMLIKNRSTLSKADYKVITEKAHNLSNTIIRGDQLAWSHFKWMNIFKQIDLMTMMASKALRVGLKSLQVTMCYKNVKEMNVNWDVDIEEHQIDNLIYYCDNDVDSTAELLKLLKEDLKLRVQIGQSFNIACLSKDGVGIGVDIFTNFVCDELQLTGATALKEMRDNYDTIAVKDFLLDEVQFKTDNLKKVRDFYSNLVLDSTATKAISAGDTKGSVVINKLKHSFGIGGLHSVNKPAIYISDDDWIIIDSDVASMYPSMADKWNFAPKGFKEAFLTVLRKLKTLRLEAKRNKDGTRDKTYKLALNSILGHLRNEFGPYYAPEANIGICVNGQLFLLMLIEECELAGMQCISSNTDGITMRIRRSELDKYYEICKKWEEVSRLELEHVTYEKVVMYAVNDYIAFKEGYSAVKDQMKFPSPADWIEYNYSFVKTNDDGKLYDKYVKQKGMFITYSRLSKGLDSLIVSKALIEYFGRGIPIEQTIKGSNTIWDFMQFQKIGKQYDVLWNNEKQQHINRFYVSRKGAYLFKSKEVEKFNKKKGFSETVNTMESVLSGFGVTLMNEYENKSMSEYNIDYSYYISRARQIIQDLEPNQMTLF